MNSIYRFVNPVCFYCAVLIQNFLIKSTKTLYICSAGFIPALLYILLTFHKSPKVNWLTFKMLFFGMVLGLFDFINLFLYFKLMNTASSFIVVSISAFFLIFFINPEMIMELCINLVTFLLAFSLFKTVLHYEIYGLEDSLFGARELISQGNAAFAFVFVLCILRVYLQRNIFDESETMEIKRLNIFFFLVYTGLYIFIDIPNTRKEGFFGVRYPALLISSALSSVIWILTLKEFTPERCRNYTFVCFFILVVYFIIPWFPIFNLTRIESSLYFVYLSLFIALIALFLFARLQKFLPEERFNLIRNIYQESTDEFTVTIREGTTVDAQIEPNVNTAFYAVQAP